MSRRFQGARLSRRMPGGAAPAFSPLSLGPVLWLRADMGITLNGGTVSQWNDQSGTGDTNKNQEQGTPGFQPTYNSVDAGYNNQPTLSYDAVDDRLVAVGAWASAPPSTCTWFVVGETAAAGTSFYFADSGVSSNQVWRTVNGGNYDINWYLGVTLTATFSGTDTTKRIYCVEGNGATSKIYRDSLTAAVTGNAGAGGAATRVSAQGANGSYGGTKLAELIGYSGVLSVANRTLVMQYLASRYGIILV